MTNLSLRLKVSDKDDFLPPAWRNNRITLLNFPEDILGTRGRVGFQTYSRALKRKQSESIDYDVMWHSILFAFEWFWFHKETIKGHFFIVSVSLNGFTEPVYGTFIWLTGRAVKVWLFLLSKIFGLFGNQCKQLTSRKKWVKRAPRKRNKKKEEKDEKSPSLPLLVWGGGCLHDLGRHEGR